ncbi:MAG: hypothetical protein NT007_01490, partial [Candidatus Kapabacteria bacterium]|nr:hypothetical protein [Candidatus Kapabacteria bacterium]
MKIQNQFISINLHPPFFKGGIRKLLPNPPLKKGGRGDFLWFKGGFFFGLREIFRTLYINH